MHYGLARFTAVTLALAFGAGNCAAAGGLPRGESPPDARRALWILGVAAVRGEVMGMGYVTALAETMLGKEDE